MDSKKLLACRFKIPCRGCEYYPDINKETGTCQCKNSPFYQQSITGTECRIKECQHFLIKFGFSLVTKKDGTYLVYDENEANAYFREAKKK